MMLCKVGNNIKREFFTIADPPPAENSIFPRSRDLVYILFMPYALAAIAEICSLIDHPCIHVILIIPNIPVGIVA